MIESNIENMIVVDEDRPLRYPPRTSRILDEHLGQLGPSSFKPLDLELWFHPNQHAGSVSGIILREHLKGQGMLESCMGLRELEAVHARGIDFFRRHFSGLVLTGFRTVVRIDHEPNMFRGSDLCVPCLCETPFEIVWCWIGNDWRRISPVVRFKPAA